MDGFGARRSLRVAEPCTQKRSPWWELGRCPGRSAIEVPVDAPVDLSWSAGAAIMRYHRRVSLTVLEAASPRSGQWLFWCLLPGSQKLSPACVFMQQSVSPLVSSCS